jgi:UDP-hydrolysing UDP-N-acetyl-D-glucosamine 2-epimerase
MTSSNNRTRRRICVVLVDRANYGRMKPVMRAIESHPSLELVVVAGGTMPLERFGRAVDIVRDDGFEIEGQVLMELEGSTPVTMAKSVGFGVIEFASEFQRLEPNLVLIIGDRYEALAATLAAAFMNLCVVHIQGGEVSGSIDESTRHAMTKFSHFHFPATRRAADYLVRMGERRDTILGVGCPSSDIARQLDRHLSVADLNVGGSGATIDPSKPFLLVLFHPITTEYGSESNQMNALLDTLRQLAMPTLLLWPNIDAGADHISKSVRQFRDRHKPSWLRTATNMEPETYLRTLASAACAIGNSSSFVRDAGYFGTPVALVGDRQNGREHDVHVQPVAPDGSAILDTIRAQLAHGRYAPSSLYGDGFVSDRIADGLARLEIYNQKRLAYDI